MIFTQSVGVSPGTTTIALGSCPPDERNLYTVPPYVDTAQAPSGAAAWNPYATESQLRGLGDLPEYGVVTSTIQNLPKPTTTKRHLAGATAPRWGIILGTGALIFAAVVGVSYWRSL